jgi:hypothetical protein
MARAYDAGIVASSVKVNTILWQQGHLPLLADTAVALDRAGRADVAAAVSHAALKQREPNLHEMVVDMAAAMIAEGHINPAADTLVQLSALAKSTPLEPDIAPATPTRGEDPSTSTAGHHTKVLDVASASCLRVIDTSGDAGRKYVSLLTEELMNRGEQGLVTDIISALANKGHGEALAHVGLVGATTGQPGMVPRLAVAMVQENRLQEAGEVGKGGIKALMRRMADRFSVE